MDPQESPTYAFISTTSTTFHPENPLEHAIIDNPGLVRRRRRKTSARELEVLETAFRECEKPSKQTREEIARKTGMDAKAVQVISSPRLRLPPGFLTIMLMVDMVPEQETIYPTIIENSASYS